MLALRKQLSKQRIVMEIKTTDGKYIINIDATTINDTLDGIVSALLLEGYPANVIHDGLIGKVDSMESEFSIGD